MTQEDRQGEPAEQQRQEWAARAEKMRPEIRGLLVQLAPLADADALEKACQEVVSAVGSCIQQSLATKAEPLTLQRRYLESLRDKLAVCSDALNPHVAPTSAISLVLSEQLGQQTGTIRNLRLELSHAITAIDSVLGRTEMQTRPGPQIDRAAVELSATLRWTLGRTLGLRVVMLPDDRLTKAAQGEAANFSRLLRLALSLAGREAPEDATRIMRQGRKLLRSRGFLATRQMTSNDYPEGVAVLEWDYPDGVAETEWDKFAPE